MPTAKQVREHEGRVPQPGVPPGPRNSPPPSRQSGGTSGNLSIPGYKPKTPVVPYRPAVSSPASTAAVHTQAVAVQRAQIRQERAEVQQARIIDQYVHKAFNVGKPKPTKSALGVPAVTQTVEKAKQNVNKVRDLLLNHPEVKAANAEGKVVGPKGLSHIRQFKSQMAAIKGPHGLKYSKEYGWGVKGLPLTQAQVRHLERIAGTPQGRVGRTEAKIAERKQIESEPSIGDIGHVLSSVGNWAKEFNRKEELSNPGTAAARHFIEDEAKNVVKVVQHRQEELQRGEVIPLRAPTKEEVKVLTLIPAAEGLGLGVRAGARASEIAGELATREGASAAASAAVQKASAVRGIPSDLLDLMRSSPEIARNAPRAARDALHASPEALKAAARRAPGAVGRGATGTGKNLYNLGTVGAVGKVSNQAGAHIPIVGDVPAMLEGTGSALIHHPKETLETTGRVIPGFITGPASLAEAAGESVLTGSPKPLEKTSKNLAEGTYEMGAHLLSGNPEEVEKAVRQEVGLVPYLPAPAFLRQLHGSDFYTKEVRAPVRHAVENRRASKREKAINRSKNDGLNAPKEFGRLGARRQKGALKAPVPVPGAAGEHYIFRSLGQLAANHHDRAQVALDAARASDFANAWNQIETNRLRKAAHGKLEGVSPLAKKMGRSYEAAAAVMAKYGIPHSPEGLDLMKALEEYYGAPADISRPDRAITDRIATHEANQHGVLRDKRHLELTEELRGGQQRIAKELPREYGAKPHRIQADFTNHVRVSRGEAPILKDTERISKRAHQFTSPEEAATALSNLADHQEALATKLRSQGDKAENDTVRAKKVAQADAIDQQVADLRAHAEHQAKGFGLDSEQVSRQGAWAHYDELKARSEALRKEAKSARSKGRQAEADNLYRQAREVQAQKKQLYAELKPFARRPEKVDTSTLKGSGRAMKREFVQEQRQVAADLGLVEPVHIHDELPQTPGPKTSKGVTRQLPGRVQHHSTGELARSGEADARFENVLQKSAIAPRTQIALNDLIHQSLNDLKSPVRTESGKYKHVLTEAEKAWAENHHAMPAGTEFFPTPLLKAALNGSHDLSAGETLQILDAVRNADTPEGIAKLVEQHPDLKEEIYAHNKGKGLTYTAVRSAGMNELIAQLKGAEHSTLHTIANIPTRIVLNDPAWVFAQLFATGIPIATAIGPSALLHAPMAIRAMAKIQKMDPVSQAEIKAMIGTSAGVLGTPHGAFHSQDPYTNARAIKRSSAGRTVWNLANGNTMGKWDRWNSSKMREFAAAVRASKGFRNWYGGFKGLDKGMEEMSKATKGMSPAERLQFIAKNPKMSRDLQKAVNKMGGNWNSFTAMERKVAPFTVFYPWIRYSLVWVLHTYPINHPVAATVLALLAQRNANELQKIAATEAKEAGVTGITPASSLADVLSYANPVHLNAEGKPVENPSGGRFSPLGVVSQTVLSGDKMKALQAANPWINMGVSLVTGKNTFTGQDLEGSLLENVAEQALSLSPAARQVESLIGFRGFTKHQPQSAWSKAYETLQGGKGAKRMRSFVNPYTNRPVSKGALENALSKVGNKIGRTGSEAQAKVEGNLLHGSLRNRKEAEKLVAENHQAWEEFEKLLGVIDPSGKLAAQSKEEYEHYKASLPPIGGAKKSGIYGGGESIYGGGKGSESIYGGGSSIYGEEEGENLHFKGANEEGLHVPSIPGIGAVTNALGSVVGGEKAQAATLARQYGTGKVPAGIISSNPTRSKEFRKAEGGGEGSPKANKHIAGELKSWGLDPSKVAVLRKVEKETGVPAPLLASISKTESSNGTSMLPGVHSGQNYAGAAGPFQMGNGTGAAGDAWQTYSQKVWGANASKHSVYNYADAARAAGEYLKAAGVTHNPSTWTSGALAYNHSEEYASEVVGNAQAAAKLPWGTASARALTLTIPKPALNRYKAAQSAATQLARGHIPYGWGGGHAGFEKNPSVLDCSGAVSWVLAKMGVLKTPLTSAEMGQVLKPGPGAVTVFYNDTHTFMKIGNKYFGTSVDNSSKGLAYYGAPPKSYLDTFNVGHVPGLGKRAAQALGVFTSGGGGSVASESFPGMTLSSSGTTATIQGGGATTSSKPGFTNKPILSETAAKRLQEVERITAGNFTGLGIPRSSSVGPSASDLQAIGESVASARRKLAVR